MATSKKISFWIDLQKWMKLQMITKKYDIPTIEILIVKTLDDLIHDEEVLIPEFENKEFLLNPTIE